MQTLATPSRPPLLSNEEYRHTLPLHTLPPAYLARIIPNPGANGTRADGLCIMEMTAWAAGERHTDSPQCVCKTITFIMAAWNDAIPDPSRRMSLLNHLVPHITGTARGDHIAMLRHYAAFDHAVHHHLPTWLRTAGLHQQALELAQSPTVPPPGHPDHRTNLNHRLKLLSRTHLHTERHRLPDAHQRPSHFESVAEAGTQCLLNHDDQAPEGKTSWDEIHLDVANIAVAAADISQTHLTEVLAFSPEEASAFLERTVAHLQLDTSRFITQLARLTP